jgi:hypothetical protein
MVPVFQAMLLFNMQNNEDASINLWKRILSNFSKVPVPVMQIRA